jgi:type IV secretory pathway VirB10-like protein
MNSIWLKIAGVAVVAVIVIVVVGRFQSSDKPSSASSTPAQTKQAEKAKTFYDMADRDKQFAKVPKEAEAQPAEEQAPAAPAPAAQPPQPPVQAPPQPVADNYVMPSSITQRLQLYFKPLSEEDQMQAQQLLSWATTGRSIGRLPMMSYGPMVRSCRDVISRWPSSYYAFQAKRALEDIVTTSSRVGGFNITRQEMDITPFLKLKPGMQAIWVDPVQR